MLPLLVEWRRNEADPSLQPVGQRWRGTRQEGPPLCLYLIGIHVPLTARVTASPRNEDCDWASGFPNAFSQPWRRDSACQLVLPSLISSFVLSWTGGIDPAADFQYDVSPQTDDMRKEVVAIPSHRVCWITSRLLSVLPHPEGNCLLAQKTLYYVSRTCWRSTAGSREMFLIFIALEVVLSLADWCFSSLDRLSSVWHVFCEVFTSFNNIFVGWKRIEFHNITSSFLNVNMIKQTLERSV